MFRRPAGQKISKEREAEFYALRKELTLYWLIQDFTGEVRGPSTKYVVPRAGWTSFGVMADNLGRAEWANKTMEKND